MARASYVYAVTQHGAVVAGFTVKHELRSWLRRQAAIAPGLDGMVVTRVRDGGYDPERNAVMELDEVS